MLKNFMKKHRFWMAGIVSCFCFVACMYVCAVKPTADFATENVDDSKSTGYDDIERGYVISNEKESVLEFQASKNDMDSVHLNLVFERISGKYDVAVTVIDDKGDILGKQTLTADENYNHTFFKIDFDTIKSSKNHRYTVLVKGAEKQNDDYLVFKPQLFVGYEIAKYRPFLKVICTVYVFIFAGYMALCVYFVKKGKEYEDSGLAWTICHLVMLFLFAIIFARQYAYGFWDLHIIAVEFLLSVLLMVFNVIWMLQMQKEHLPLYKMFLVLGIAVGLSFDFIVPIGVTPDDIQHIYSSYYVASVLMGKQQGHDVVQCRENEEDYVIKTVMSRKHSNQYYISMLDDVPKEITYVDGQYTTDKLYNPHWTAVIPALGIVLARLLHMNAFWTLMMGRVFNTFVFLMATTYAIKKAPVGKSVIFAVSFLPMVQQQMNSYSHDNIIMCASVLIFAIGMYWCSKERQIRISDVILYCLAVIVACRVKGGTYAIFALIPVLFHWQDKDYRALLKKYRWLIVAGCAAIVCMMFWGQISGIFVSNDARVVGGAGNYLEWADAYSYSLSDLLHNPKRLAGILVNTYLEQFDYYFTSMISDKMGWLEFSLPTYVFVLNLLIVVFAICCDSTAENNFLQVREIILGLLMAIVTFGLCAAGLLLDYTPNTSAVIEGVQGRYFIPGALLICIVLSGLKGIRVEDTSKKHLPVMAALVMFVNYFALINSFTF